MSSLRQRTSWICRSCVSGLVQQRRGLRVRPRARPQVVEAKHAPPTDTITLTDGTTIRVQPDRPLRSGPVAQSPTWMEEEEEPIPSTKEPAISTRQPPPQSTKRHTPRDHGELVPSAPSAPLRSSPKSKDKTPPDTPPTGPHDYNWYFETSAPTPAHKTHANSFFDTHGKSATLLRSIAHFRTLPATSVPEVAFIGRSNVGKSSLLNAVMGCDTSTLLARTSRTPGFTKTMNLYGIGPGGVGIKTSLQSGSGLPGRETISGPRGLTIVDMPGYGSGSLSAWGVEILKYIQARKALRRVFVLLDAQHGVKERDRSVLASLRAAGVSHQVILSKVDKIYIPPASEIRRLGRGGKVKSMGQVGALRKRMRELLPDIQPPHGGAALGEVLACSSEVLVDGRRLGIEDVRYAVLKAVGLEGEERKGFTESKRKKRAAKAEAEAEAEAQAEAEKEIA